MAKDLSEEKIILIWRDGIRHYPLAVFYDAEDHQHLVSNSSGTNCSMLTVFSYCNDYLQLLLTQGRQNKNLHWTVRIYN